MRIISNLLNLIASLITILNVILALPSVFQDFKSISFLEITEKNFSLKFGFILLLQFGLAIIHSSFQRYFEKIESKFTKNSFSLFFVILLSWLTIFNITEILYLGLELSSFEQYLGMFFFLCLCYLIHIYILYSASFGKFSISQNYDFERWIVFLGILNFILFIVYWING